MEIRYLIGIDFGHGETTASYLDINEERPTPKSLHIRDGQNADQDKVESCICKDKETGEWRFVGGIEDYSSSDFRIGFKAPMNEITPENKEAFGAFIKLVFSKILKFQNFLRYDPATGKRNFELCVACPSGWNDETNNQIHEYLDFMRSFMPVSWVIKESDAAYFKFRDNDFVGKTVLVIDVGSSTIDFTYYDTAAGRAKDPIGYPHGASHVEKSILEYLNNTDPTFQEGKKKLLDCTSKNEGNANWLKAALHYVKGQKEDLYTSELKYIDLNTPLRRFAGSLRSGHLFDCEIEKETLEGCILKDYMDKLRNDFKTVAGQVSPQIVILTGGASRMPWLAHLAKDVFTETNPNVKVYKDSNPSYVVSHGIVQYALARTKFEKAFEVAKTEFWSEFTDEKLLGMVHEYFNDALREIQIPMIQLFMDKWLTGDIKDNAGCRSTQALIPYFDEHNNTVLGDRNEEIQKMVNERIDELFRETFITKIGEIFRECFNGHNPDVPMSVNVDLSFGGIRINPDYDRRQLENITKAAYKDIFFDGRIDKDRATYNERKVFYDKMIEMEKTTPVVLSETTLEGARDRLKSCITEYLDEVKRHPPFTTYE